MWKLVNKPDLIKALREREIDFPVSATVAQMRSLLEVAEAADVSAVSNGSVITAVHAVSADSVLPAAATMALTPTILIENVNSAACISENVIPTNAMNNEMLALDYQPAIARKKVQLQALTRELEQIQPARINRVRVEDIVRIIPKFDGNRMASYDVRHFINDLEQMCQAHQCDDAFKYICLRSLLVGAAADCANLSNVCDYNGLKTILITEFGQVLSYIEHINRLRFRFWNKDTEDMHHYVIIMSGLAKHSQLRDYELVGIIVDGMRLPSSRTNHG